MAVLEKGKSVGAHALSGAVVNPRALRRLFRDRARIEDMPFYGPVEHESVYFLTPRSALRIPTPPTMKNDGNYVASLSELTRWLAGQRRRRRYILPERLPRSCSGRRAGRRDPQRRQGRGRDARRCPTRAGSDVTAKLTVLSEGTQGPDRSGMVGSAGEREPQVWAIGVRRSGRSRKPRTGSSNDGRPLAAAASTASRRSFIYPMGDDGQTRNGRRRDYRDAELSVHEILQELKTHKVVRRILEGGERVVGREDDPRGGYVALPRRCMRRASDNGDGAGLVNVRNEGDPLRDRVGAAAAETAFAASSGGGRQGTPVR